MARITHKILMAFIATALISSNSLFAQSSEINIGKVSPGEVDMAAFSLSQSDEIKINGKGATFGHWEEEMAFYGWILNSETREVVWHLREESEFDEDEGIFEFYAEVDLPAGNYEVYYAGSVRNYIKISGWGDFWNNMFGESKYKASYRKQLFMTVKGSGSSFSIENPKELLDNKINNAIVSINRMGDYDDAEKSFTLTEDTEVRIYALGEGRSGSNYDFGWIYDEDNHERIWTMNSKRADHAGGGKKNMLIDKRIMLPAGSYTVRYSTDDSHSFDEWNVLPPDDPQMWGITLFAEDESDLANVKPFTAKERVQPIVELVRVGDDEFLSQGFTLNDDMELRIFCLGEGSGRIMADYGWIINAETKETVWKMNIRRTEHGGGADKNRLFDDVISFNKGNYIAYYTTDGSHSYEDWNSTRPIESERWGLTIWTKDKNKRDEVELFDESEYKNENLIAEIVRVRDHKEIDKRFKLDDDTSIRIISIGEGDRSGMYDYAYIENDRGKVVWEMTYRKTEHAGGAKKNRLFNDTIMLEKGTYYVYYHTDGSHSYNDWNSSPPDNPEMYGVTILFEKD
jgi:hypothetical protein